MRKASSYSQFRKQIPLWKDPAASSSDHINIDELSKQLEQLGTKKNIDIEHKYRSVNGAIEEVEEEESPQCTLTKRKALESNKLSTTAQKNLKFEPSAPKKIAQKLNRSMESFTSGRKIGREDNHPASRKEKLVSEKNSLPASKGVGEVVKYKDNKRESLKLVDNPISLMSTSSSMGATRLLCEDDKETAALLLHQITAGLQKKNVSKDKMIAIVQKLRSIDKILGSC